MKLHTGESVSAKDWSWEDRRRLGQRYLKDLAEDIINVYEKKPYETYGNTEKVRAIVKTLKAQLELDGYIYRDRVLLYSESSVIDEVQEQSYLENLVDKVALSDKETINHHIQLAEEHYVNGRWGDQHVRKIVESS